MDETTAFANFSENKDSRVELRPIRRIRALFIVINILFGLFGLLVTLFSIFILTDGYFWIIANQTQQIHRLVLLDIRAWMILLLFGGILSMVLSVLGITGKPSLLRFYCIIMGTLLVVDLAAFSLTLLYQSKLEKIYQTNMAEALKDAVKAQDKVFLDKFHELEKDLNCTGANGPEDYGATASSSSIGCSAIILNYLRHRVCLVVLSVLGFAVFELFGMIIGLLVIRAIRENPDYHYVTNPNGILAALIPRYK